ncbi:MAG: spore germination protein [Lachnospiraceae bacterium]|nr:spore germination protein [Lachnospiraceae bacterium]MBP3610700.1 spore germination protein [Lachnospiraceae bacterium]
MGEKEQFYAELSRYKTALRSDASFDVVVRVFMVSDKQAAFFFIDGMIKDETMQKMMQGFAAIKPEDMPQDAAEFAKYQIPYVEVEVLPDMQTAVNSVLSGAPCLLVEGYHQAISIDIRTYPARSVSEPEKDKVMRGSRDGFVETLVFNTALIRRRIRDPKLTMEYCNVGTVSHTDVVLCYMTDRVDEQYLTEIRKRINNIQVESLTMNQESLAECLYESSWWNPFPKFKFSERPDTASAAVLEGNIVILVDNSPAAMILPTSIFDIIEEADDYYFPPVTGTYLRLTRVAANVLAFILTPLFLLLMQQPDRLPESFAFIALKEPLNIPLLWQFLILEFSIDGLRLAALNTPSMLSLPLSVISALVLGEFAVSSGWFNAEPLLYMAFVILANYTQASYELGYAIKFLRIITLVLTNWLGIWGFGAGIALCIFCIGSNKAIGGKSYVYPLFPLHFRKLMKRFFRVSLLHESKHQGGNVRQ